MERFRIFLFTFSPLLAFATHSSGVRQRYSYQLSMIKHATEVREEWTRSEAHRPSSAFDDVRLTWCRNGFQRVKKSRRGKHIRFLQNATAGPLKFYAFVESAHEADGKTGIAVVPAFECPTSPAIYIYTHLDTDEDDDAEEKVLLWVLFKGAPHYPWLKDIINFQVKIVDKIIEADVTEMKVTAKKDIVPSVFDTDDLLEAQRLQMCRRVIQTVPDLAIELSENELTGKSKYYIAIAEMNRREEKTNDLRLIVQAFDCPTAPKLYVSINVRDDPRDGYILWAMTRANETSQRRPILLDIMGYNVVVVKSMTVSTIPVERENESTDSVLVESRYKTDESTISQHFGKFTTRRDASEKDGFLEGAEENKVEFADSVVAESRAELDDFHSLKSFRKLDIDEEENTISPGNESPERTDAKEVEFAENREATDASSDRSQSSVKFATDGDTNASKILIVNHGRIRPEDDLKEGERLALCENAIKAISVQGFQFTGRPPGPSQYYALEKYRTSGIGDIVCAFECPTAPRIFLHVTDRESIENMVWVIVVGTEDFEQLTARFRK